MADYYSLIPEVSQGGTIRHKRTYSDHLIDLPITGRTIIRDAIMQRRPPWHKYTQKKRKKYHRNFPYKRIDRGLVPKMRVGWAKYVSEDLSYAPAATSGSLNFNLNDMSDPGAALGAQLPQWWTEISAMYVHYKVNIASWHIHISNTSTDQVQGAYCMCRSTEVCPATAAGLTECIQKGKPFWLGATDENLTNHTDLHSVWSIKRHEPKDSRDAADYGAAVTLGPAKTWMVNIVLNSAANISVKYRIIINFYVELSELQQNAPD